MGFFDFLTGGQGDYFQPTAYNNNAARALSDGTAYSGAAQQATANPYLSGILAPGGSLNQAENQATQLQNTGFQLQPQDYQAYGQASNNIARNYGAQESSLANSLAGRGLSNSGAAGAQFTGLQGSKNEQLAAAQGDIANARMNFAQNALNNTRNSIAQMAGVGNQATAQGLQGLESGAQDYTQGYNAQNHYGEDSALNQQAQQTGGLIGALGAGITSGVAGLGKAIPGMVTGGLGSALGGLGGGSSQGAPGGSSPNNSLGNSLRSM